MRKNSLPKAILLVALASVAGLGCELIVDFDRTKIPSDTPETGAPDTSVPDTGAIDTGVTDAASDASDAATDAGNDADLDASDSGDAADQ